MWPDLALTLLMAGAGGPTSGSDGYVGNEACASCHAGLARSFAAHPMGRSSGRVPAAGLPGLTLPAQVEHLPSGVRYTVARRSEGLVLQYARADGPRPLQGSVTLDHFVGGKRGYSFLHANRGYLYQSPVSFYLDGSAWRISPGYEEAPFVALSRPAQLVCVECHFSGVEPVPGASNGFAAVPYRQDGVGCERCHGPGEAHRRHMLGGGRGDPQIVNPARLAPERRDSVCGQCHLQGAARLLKRGCGLGEYRPGDALADVAPVYVWTGETGPLDQTSHYQKLRESACHRESQGRLWCGSCHDPHRAVEDAGRAAHYRERCLRCHEGSSCRAPAGERRATLDDCTSCHMPTQRNETIVHATTTDHAIPRRPGASLSGAAAGARRLVPFWGGIPSTRDLGLAYASLVTERAAHREQAEELLRRAYGEGARDPQTLIVLATYLEAAGSSEKAAPLYEQALAAGGGCADETAVAENRLGALRAAQGRVEEAVRLFGKALVRVPVYEAARVNLARAVAARGDTVGAERVLAEGLELEPDSAPLREFLSTLRPSPLR